MYSADLLKKKIMRQVYLVWFLRSITSFLGVQVFLFMFLFGWFIHCVSLGHIAINAFSAMNSFSNATGFFISAFSAAEITVKLILPVLLVLSLFLGRNIFKKFFQPVVG